MNDIKYTLTKYTKIINDFKHTLNSTIEVNALCLKIEASRGAKEQRCGCNAAVVGSIPIGRN